MTSVDLFFFGIYPYIAVAIFLIGSLVRHGDPLDFRHGSPCRIRRCDGAPFARGAFHMGLIVLLVGHVVGLPLPSARHAILGSTVEARHMISMIASGLFGVVCLFGTVLLIPCGPADGRTQATGPTIDMVILQLLFALLVLCLSTSACHNDAGTMLALAEWGRRIATFDAGAADLVMGTDVASQLHLVLGLTILLLAPFSRLRLVWSMPSFSRGFRPCRRG